MLSGYRVSKPVSFDTCLNPTAGSEYQCHSSCMFVPLGADQALEVSRLSWYNCYRAVDLFSVMTRKLCWLSDSLVRTG